MTDEMIAEAEQAEQIDQNPPWDGEGFEEEQDTFPNAIQPATLQAAAEDLENLTPEELVMLKQELDDMDTQIQLPEAGGLVWTKVYHKKTGAEFTISSRAHNATAAMMSITKCINHAVANYGMSLSRLAPPPPAGQKVAQAPTPKPAPTPTPTPTPQPQTSAPQKAQTQTSRAGGGEVVDSNTNELHWISVERHHKDPSRITVKFMVGQFNYPFPDNRKADAIAEVFDSELGYTEEHFSEEKVGSLYKIDGELVADWEKVQKGNKAYYNVLRVHKP
jgi:hypothetical protein